MTSKSLPLFFSLFLPLCLLSILLWAFHPSPVYAATIIVTTTTDENDGCAVGTGCSIREAITTAVAGDTIDIPAGTYTLALGQLSVSKSLIFTGAGSATTVINGNATNRVFTVSGVSTVLSLNDLTIRNGAIIGAADGGGMLITAGTVTLADVVVENNSSGRNGGGIYITAGTLTLINTTIQNNTTTTSGGGVYSRGGSVTLQSGQISLNLAASGGGVYVNQGGATFTQEAGTIDQNTATANMGGAGIYVNMGSFVMNGGQINNNTATAPAANDPFPGGGVYIATGSATLNGGEIHNNTAYRGAGVLVNNGTLTLDGGQILSNTATYGGGVYVVQTNGLLDVITGTIAYNAANPAIADFGGGGVYVFNGSITMQGGVIRNNTTNYNGAGINVAQGTVTLTGGEISNNTASNSGGGLYARNSAAVMTVSDAVITNNSPNAFGIEDGTVTFRGNDISTHTTVFRQTGGTLTAYANNISSFTTGVNSTGGTFNGRHNWWGDYTPAGVGNTAAFDYRLGAPVLDWGLGALADGATISGGTGQGVVVSHGSVVPFNLPATPSGTLCSGFYDFFTAPGASNNWTVQVPVSASSACDLTFNSDRLYHFALNGSNAPNTACTPVATCWVLYGSVSHTVGSPRTLNVTLTTAELGGTPIIAGNTSGNSPTAITLSTLTAESHIAWAGLTALAGLLLVTTTAVSLRRRGMNRELNG